MRSLDRRRAGARDAERIVVLAVAAALLGFTAVTVALPLLQAAGWSWAGLFRPLYAPVCHQDAARCLVIAELPLAACARCVGLYAGAALGLVLFALARRGPVAVRPIWLPLAVAPTLWDVAAPWLGMHALANGGRFWLSLPTGAVLGIYLAIGLVDLTAMLRSGSRRSARGLAPQTEPPSGGCR